MPSTIIRKQVRRVLLITLLLNIAVAAGKILLGMLTGALAITADGLHSLADSAGNIVGLVANHYAALPPDDHHPYGHRRFETVAALVIGALLLLTAWEMIGGLIERLQSPAFPAVTPLTFGVLILTLFINLFVSRYQIKEGRRLRSEILLADAHNTQTDVFVTLSVIGSMIFVVMGWWWMDTAAALVVVILIVRAAWQILRQTGSVLVDTAPYSPEKLAELVRDVPNIQQVIRARSRGPQDSVHVDVDLRVAPEMTAVQAEAVAAAVRERLAAQISGLSEVEVHFAPHFSRPPDYALTARALADKLGLSTHEVYISEGPRGRALELHVEVPPGQTLEEAHQRVTQLEHDLHLSLPEIDRVVTHIEPAPPAKPAAADSRLIAHARQIEAQAQALLRSRFPDVVWHDLLARTDGSAYLLMLHAALPPQLSIEAAHTMAERAEMALKMAIPQLARVTIHTEPWE